METKSSFNTAIVFLQIQKFFSPLVICILVLIASLWLPSSVAAFAREAGTVISLTPGAFVERDGKKTPLAVKSTVYAGDVLTT